MSNMEERTKTYTVSYLPVDCVFNNLDNWRWLVRNNGTYVDFTNEPPDIFNPVISPLWKD
jgi:hypothetical protein